MASISTVSGCRTRRRYSLIKAFRRIVSSQPLALVPCSYWSHARYALRIVSCTRSSASAEWPVGGRGGRCGAWRWTRASGAKLSRLASTGVGAGVGPGIGPKSGRALPGFAMGRISRLASQSFRTGLGFALRGAQHPTPRRPRGRAQPRHSCRGWSLRIRGGIAGQATGPVEHRGDAAGALRRPGAARRARRGRPTRSAAAPRRPPPRRRARVRGRRPSRRPACRAPRVPHPAVARPHRPAPVRIRRGPRRRAVRVRRRPQARGRRTGGRPPRRHHDPRHARRRRLRPVGRGAGRAAAPAHRLRRRDAAHGVPRVGRRRLRVARRAARSAAPLMPPLANLDLAQVRAALAALGVDGWLVFDFHGANPVAPQVLGILGTATRRLFVLLPRDGAPVAVAHRIELQPFAGFPGEVRPYSAWSELHARLRELVAGKRLAMEVSPNEAVPYLDRVPHGVVQLLESFGATIVSSGPLVTRFAARWSADELAGHRRAADALPTMSQEAPPSAAAELSRGSEVREVAVQQRVVAAIARAGLFTDHPPIVGFQENAANPHYEPRAGSDRRLAAGDVLLLDLWAGPAKGSVFADQTWMAFAGRTPPPEVVKVWTTVRDARDAAVARLREA